MKIISDKNVLDTFCEASEILYKAIAHTLGPNGYNTAVVMPMSLNTGRFSIINDGLSIIMQLSSETPEVASAIEVLKEVAVQTNKIAGDGTTSSVIFIYNLLDTCRKLRKKDKELNCLDLSRQLKRIKQELLSNLKEKLVKPADPSLYSHIIETSMGSNSSINGLIQEAFEFASSYGDVLFKRVEGTSSYLNKTNSVILKNLHIMSPECLPEDVLKDCKVIAVQSEIQNLNEITSLLSQAKSSQNPVILIAEGLSQSVKEFLYKNILQSNLSVYPIILSGNSEQNKMFFDAVKLITGNSLYDQLVLLTKNIKLEDIKTYPSVQIQQNQLLFDDYQSEEFTKMCLEKNYKIPQKVAEICIASDTSISSEELIMRVEDTVSSLRNSILTGVVVGGGFSYCTLLSLLESEDDRKLMVQPLTSILNRNLENLQISQKEFENSIDSKVYDSYTVCEQVISNSIDIVCSILSTKIMVIEKEI